MWSQQNMFQRLLKTVKCFETSAPATLSREMLVGKWMNYAVVACSYTPLMACSLKFSFHDTFSTLLVNSKNYANRKVARYAWLVYLLFEIIFFILTILMFVFTILSLNLTICNFTMNCVNVPVPETPTNVRATGVTNTSIALMWDEVKGIDCEFVTVVGSCMYTLPLLY